MQDAPGELWMSTYRVHERHMTLHLDVSKIFGLKRLLLRSLIYVTPFLLSLTCVLLLCLRHQVLMRHREFAAQPDGLEGVQQRPHKDHENGDTLPPPLRHLLISTPVASRIFLKLQR